MAACGGDDSDTNTTTNTVTAGQAVTQVGSFRGAVAGTDGGAAAGAVYSLGGSAQSIITPAAAGASARAVPVRAVTGTCTCDASGCTFVDCGDEATGWSMNGTIGISGDTYTFDVEMSLNYQGQSWDWAYAGSLTITETSVDGSLDGTGTGTFMSQEGDTLDFDWSWSVDYNDIALDTTGCAVGGSLDASASYSGSANGQDFSYSGSGSVDFGPACGQATAR